MKSKRRLTRDIPRTSDVLSASDVSMIGFLSGVGRRGTLAGNSTNLQLIAHLQIRASKHKRPSGIEHICLTHWQKLTAMSNEPAIIQRERRCLSVRLVLLLPLLLLYYNTTEYYTLVISMLRLSMDTYLYVVLNEYIHAYVCIYRFT